MRKGLLGSIAALAAGAGAAWGQPPVSPIAATPPATAPAAPAAKSPATAEAPTVPQPPLGGPPRFGGTPSRAIPGNAGFPPPPIIMPPGNYGPADDPLGLGPVGGFGPPPAPMYPMPGPYGAQTYQPAPPMPNVPFDLDGIPGYKRGHGRYGIGHGGLIRKLMEKNELNYGAAPCFWFDGEYLLWFVNGQNVNFPLLTTSAPSDAGLLGLASTTVLVGQRDLGYNAINGLRLRSGFFGDADRRFGFEMSGFILERAANIQRWGDTDALPSGIPVFARPFIDLDNLQSTVILSNPDFGPASVEVGTNTQTWGVEPVALWNLYRSEPDTRFSWSLDFLAGYKYLQLKEELWVHSRTQLDDRTALPVFQTGPFGIITQLPAIIAPAQTTMGGVTVGGPATVIIRDQFRATNKFNGFVLGFRGETRYGMVTTSTTAKIAIGNMHERIEITGYSSFFDPTGRSGTRAGTLGGFNLGVGGGAGAAVGGVLANPSNIGTFVKDRFSYIPEGSFDVGIALTKGLTGYIGVSIIYIPEVIRPGNIINPLVSSAAIPFAPNYGAADAPRGPSVNFVQDHFLLGGVNFGLKYTY